MELKAKLAKMLFASLSEDEKKTVLEEKVQMAEAELADGTKITYEGDALVEGTVVSIMTEAGEMLPVPDGDHELSDGRTITVADGAVTAIADKVEEMKEDKGIESRIAALEDAIKGQVSMAAEISEAVKTLKESMSKQSKDNQTISTVLEKFLAESSEKEEKPVNKTEKFNVADWKRQYRDDLRNIGVYDAKKIDRKFALIEKKVEQHNN